MITTNDLIRLVGEAKNDCEKTIQEKKIIHLLIDNYLIDKNNFSNFPKDKKCESYSIDIRFITLPEKYIKNLEQILKKYQITIDQIVSAEYVRQFFSQNEHNFFDMAGKIIDGCNENEVVFVNKSRKNRGFFERFFNLFS